MNLESTTTAMLLANAFLLGLRHGIDWDHIAAIFDIVGSTTSEAEGESANAARRIAPVLLSTFYACGHAFVVLILGIAAICFATILPEWVDPLMERVVGATLIALGIYVIYSLFRYLKGQEEFKLQSRWMMLYSLLQNWFSKTLSDDKSARGSDEFGSSATAARYGRGTAFGVGMIHGIGAETGTQVLLIATVGGASAKLGLMILLTFVIGLICSNTALALLGSLGFAESKRAKPFYALTGGITGVFSLAIGFVFVSGMAERLPDLQNLLKSGVFR